MIADMAFIFFNSAQNSTSSSTASKNVTQAVAPIVIPDYDSMDASQKNEAFMSLDSLVRCCAHVLQFIPLGFSLYLLLCTFALPFTSEHLKIPLTLAFSFLFALSDEIHQYFTPGRSFQLSDLGLDMCGVAIGCAGGIVLMLIIGAAVKHRQTSDATD